MAAPFTMHLAVSRLLVGAALLCSLQPAMAATPQDATFAVKLLAPETALAAAQAALLQCRKAGYQVAVAVVDRFGTLQVLLRDRFAGAHTVEFAMQKAWTAASFKLPTSALAEQTQAGKPMSGMRANTRVLAIGGGQTIEAGGTLLGGIGVSGAPGGEADDSCALGGLRAIADAIEF